MKEKKLIYIEPEIEVTYFNKVNIVTLSGSDSGKMDEDDFSNMGFN